MNYPTLNEIANTRQMLSAFRGYNHNLRISDGEFYDMKNLTSTHYPVLSPRGKRGTYLTLKKPQGMIAKDSLCYVADGKFYINQYEVEGVHLTPGDKNLVSMGAYVVIFPDGVWVNTEEFDDINGEWKTEDSQKNGHGKIDRKNGSATTVDGSSNLPTKFTLCTLDNVDYTDVNKGDEAPEDATNGTYWLDKSSEPHSLKRFNKSTGMWVSVATTYIRIESPGIGAGFEKYDGVTISGLKDEQLKEYLEGEEPVVIDPSSTRAKQLSALDGSFVVQGCGEDYIIVIGILDEEVSIKNKITIERKMPKMDFVIESGNRLWGCRYGLANNNEVVNEIYASKLGDFKNWNCFMQTSQDSYVAQCGTDGAFTGAITHLGYPIFFKENCMHKVYGNYPANYQVQTTSCRGVQEGCSDSLAIVNEVLYYKSRNGICAYDGSLPAEISYVLGEVSYDDAVACGYGNKYYVSMRDRDYKYHLFVYDTAKDMWHREDNTAVKRFCSCRNELYFYEKVDDESVPVKTMFGSFNQDTTPVSWMAETGAIGVDSPDKKYISKLNIRLSLDVGTRVYVYIQYDSTGEWEKAATITGTTLRSFNLPVRPKRCDHMRIRIVGEGDAKIYSITKTIEQGSDS